MKIPNSDGTGYIQANGTKGEQGVPGTAGTNASAPVLELGSAILAANSTAKDSAGKDIEAASTYLSVGNDASGNAVWYKVSGDKGDKGDSFFKSVTDADTDIITFTLADGDTDDSNNPTFQVQRYKAFYIGNDLATAENAALPIVASTTEIPLILPSGFKESDYTAIMAQIISNKGTGTSIQTRAATAPWTVTVTKPTFTSGAYNNDAKVTVTTPENIEVGESALLEVTLVGKDGGKTVATRALFYGIAANVGDYYYSDGTYSTNLETNKTPIGIIFYTGDVTRDDAKLKAKIGATPTITVNGEVKSVHGLVVALKDASAGTAWQPNYATTNIGTGNSGDTGGRDKLCGYSNTLAMKAWNDDTANHSGSLIIAYTEFAKYSETTPASSSGWYFPSIRELSTLCSGWKDSWKYGGTYGGFYEGGLLNTISEKLKALNDSSSGSAEIIDADSFYWSSSEYSSGSYAFTVFAYDGYVWYSGKDRDNRRVRAILAFKCAVSMHAFIYMRAPLCKMLP